MPSPKKFFWGLDSTGQRVIRVGDAVDGSDAPNLAQVKELIDGKSWKVSVRAASTANVTLTAPGATIDGVTLRAQDRVLLKNQTAGAENGIWVWTSASAALTRASDANTAAKLEAAAVGVESGNVNADRFYSQNVDDIVLGTTALVWALTSGPGAYSGTNGVTVQGSTISGVADPAGGLVVGGAGFGIDRAVVASKFTTTVVAAIPAGGSVDIAHPLQTKDIVPAARLLAGDEFVDLSIVPKDANTVTISSASAIPGNSLRLTLIG